MTKFGAWLKRTGWSALAAGLSAPVSATAFGWSYWEAFAGAFITTVLSSLLVFARAQADALPEVKPGG